MSCASKDPNNWSLNTICGSIHDSSNCQKNTLCQWKPAAQPCAPKVVVDVKEGGRISYDCSAGGRHSKMEIDCTPHMSTVTKDGMYEITILLPCNPKFRITERMPAPPQT